MANNEVHSEDGSTGNSNELPSRYADVEQEETANTPPPPPPARRDSTTEDPRATSKSPPRDTIKPAEPTTVSPPPTRPSVEERKAKIMTKREELSVLLTKRKASGLASNSSLSQKSQERIDTLDKELFNLIDEE